VILRERDGAIHGEFQGTATDEARVIAQAARIVSLDHDGTGYGELGERDEVVGRLQRASGYLRPVLFHSPYEAACWSVISARTQHAQAARLRDALSAAHGERLTLAGQERVTFPAPQALLSVDAFPSLADVKLQRLHGIARAALEGRLDREPLLALDPEEATAQLLELPGIGPFYAGLILLRAVGTTDALASGEPLVREKAAEHYGAEEPFEAIAERWRPFRTWVSVLLRAAG
jgi:DNA-3-methyladenine glycosylase II